MDCNSPGTSVHGISHARVLEWVAMPSFRGSSRTRDQTWVSYIGRQILYHWATREYYFHLDCAFMKSSYQKTMIGILRVILGKSLNCFQSHFLHNKMEHNICVIALLWDKLYEKMICNLQCITHISDYYISLFIFNGVFHNDSQWVLTRSYVH